jgi:heterodisulfide reductase subunit A-like polyferredoxin
MDTPMTGTGPTGINSNEISPQRQAGGGVCATCGQPLGSRGLEQFLGKLGISDEMINNLRSQMQNVDVEEYLNTARDYLKTSSDKAKTFTKENPGKVAAGVAVLAVGAGLLISALNRE